MHSLNWFILFCLAILWAASFPAMGMALTEMSPSSLVFWRLFPVGILMMCLALLRGERFPLSLKFWSPFIILGFFFNYAPFLLISSGQQYIEAGLASIINATTPIFTGLLAHFVFANERLNLLKILALLLGVVGVGILFGIDALTDFDLRNQGQLFVIFACCCYAFSGVFAKGFIMNYSAIKSTAAMLLCSGIMAFGFVLTFEGWPQPAQTAEVWSALIFMSVGGTALAYIIYYTLIRSMGATGASLVTFIAPPLAILMSWVLLDEVLDGTAYLGMFFIFLALICMDARVQRLYFRFRTPAKAEGRAQ